MINKLKNKVELIGWKEKSFKRKFLEILSCVVIYIIIYILGIYLYIELFSPLVAEEWDKYMYIVEGIPALVLSLVVFSSFGNDIVISVKDNN